MIACELGVILVITVATVGCTWAGSDDEMS